MTNTDQTVSARPATPLNILSVDVEEWFHILDIEGLPDTDAWAKLEPRVDTNFRRMLDTFDTHGVRVTAFFLGWVAERYPDLVRETARRGHEISSHGQNHQLIYGQTPQEFAADIRRSRSLLQDLSGQPVNGYRAPGFSIVPSTAWAFDEIRGAGFTYDSSIFPAARGHGGLAKAISTPHVIQTANGHLLEFPIPIIPVMGRRVCFFGGGYLRLFPYVLIKRMAARVNAAGQPVVYYVHPREIDPSHPRLPMPVQAALQDIREPAHDRRQAARHHGRGAGHELQRLDRRARRHASDRTLTAAARMKLFIVTQDENVYLPSSIAAVCRAFPGDVTCIASAPAMSTHGGKVRGFMRHFRLFGVRGSAILGWRAALAQARALLLRNPGRDGPFHSMAQVARAFDIPYVHVQKLKSADFAAAVEKYGGDLLISMSCPQIIGKAIREKFPHGAINLHSSPLPRYRGLMPAFWVLRNGDAETAITVHDLDAKLDDGAILAQQRIEITPDETWDSLVRKTKGAGAQLLIATVRSIADGSVQRRPNLELEATYFSFPTAADKKAFSAAGRRFF